MKATRLSSGLKLRSRPSALQRSGRGSSRGCLAARRFPTAASAIEELNGLWSWCHDNGVPDVGTERCKISLFESETGDRGVYAVTDISKGETILSIPLKLSIIDYRDDDASNQLLYEGAPWSVRLACKLLRQKALGKQSAWFPYLQSLPTEIPSVLCSFSAEDIDRIEFEEVRSDVQLYMSSVERTWERLSPEAHGESSRAEFDWAMTVVHSRSVATAGKGGPLDVRMLVPLMDMFNHGGDQFCDLMEGQSRLYRADGVEWMIVPPEKARTNSWEMQMFASASISAEEEVQVFLSYGERNNDDFFLFYGFIPPLNPKADCVLFESIDQAIGWHTERFPSKDEGRTADALRAAAEEEERLTPEAKEQMEELLLRRRERLRLVTGNLVDGRLRAAFQTLGGEATVHSAIADRCWELLHAKSDLLDDLAVLAEHLPNDPSNFLTLYGMYASAVENYSRLGVTLPTAKSPRLSIPKTLSFQDKLTKLYTTQKKMILWDALLSSTVGFGPISAAAAK